MSEFKRQHPVASITRVIDLIRGNLVTIIVILVFGAGGGGPSFLWLFGGMFGFLLVAGFAGWWRFRYRVLDGELQIHHGVIVRKQLHLTRDRIQVIDHSAGLLQRWFGLVKVEIKTAGSTSREAVLSAVSHEEADRLTRELRHPEADVQQGEETSEGATPWQVLRLPLKDLLIAASTSGSFGIALSLIATLFSQLEPLLDETGIYEWVLARLPGETDAFFWISLIAVFVIFAWLVSFVGTLLRYGDFTLTVGREEMVIRRGIFEKKRITLPYNRIQAVRVVEGVLRQPFGFAAIQVESAGYGEEKEAGSVVLFPLLRVSRLDSFLEMTLPAYRSETELDSPPPRAITRYMIRSSFVLALLILAVQWLFSASPYIWTLLLGGLFWGWLRHRDAGVGRDRERVKVRSRVLARTTAMVFRNRVQELTVQSSWIQKYRRLATLSLSVASGDQGRQFTVSDLDRETADKLLPWISVNRFRGSAEYPAGSATPAGSPDQPSTTAGS